MEGLLGVLGITCLLAVLVAVTAYVLFGNRT